MISNSSNTFQQESYHNYIGNYTNLSNMSMIQQVKTTNCYISLKFPYQYYIVQNSNETMIREKYESISEAMMQQKQYEQISSGEYTAAEDNAVDKYLNFGDENNENHPVKQEELDCGFQNHNQINQDNNLSCCYDTAGISFITPDSTFNKNTSQFSNNSSDNHLPSSQLTMKMKRIMKREKAKSRRTMQQFQQNQPLQNQSSQDTQDAQFRQRNISLASNATAITTTSVTTSSIIPFEVKVEAQSSTIYPSSPSQCDDLQLKALQQQCASGLLDPKQHKKVMQMIRNRISAQNSRDRKKAYITKLENTKDEFQLESIELRQALSRTQAQLNSERHKNELLHKEIIELKKKLLLSPQPECAETRHKCLSVINGTYKNQAAISMAMFAVLGVVLIFNSKPSDLSLASINNNNNSVFISKILEDETIKLATQTKAISLPELRLSHIIEKEIETIEIKDESNPAEIIQEVEEQDYLANPIQIEDDTNQHLTHNNQKHQGADQIKKDQWIQFVVPKPNQGNTHNRDDLSRDSAETDDMSQHSGQSQKYIQVWAQIKSVNEFEQEN